MNYEEFELYVVKHIKEYLPESNQDISVVLDCKTNEREIKSSDLVVHYPGIEVGTSIHLDSVFMAYEEIEDIDSIMEDIARTLTYAREELRETKMTDLDNFEEVKDRLFLQVINQERNRSLFSKLVHRDIPNTDLAVIYHVSLVKEEPNLSGIKINQPMLRRWGIEEKELYQTALTNMVNQKPFVIRDMFQTLIGLDPAPGQIPEDIKEGTFHMLSNEVMINGASVLLYPDLLKKIGDRFESNYFIIPSSIHDLILLKDDGKFSIEFLEDMIQNINREKVAPSNFLSNHAIFYDREQERFYQVEGPERLKEEELSYSYCEDFEDELER